MVTKNYIKFALFVAALGCQACDDGPIYEPEYEPEHTGYTAKLTARISGADSWPEYYSLVLATFGDSEYSNSQSVVYPDAEGHVNLLLYNIGNDVNTVELCVTNTLRRRVVTFASADLSSATSDTIYLDAGEVDVEMYSTIQTHIFNPTCAQCHGASTTAAAGLFLTEGQSHASLVGQAATTADGMRVVPGNAEESVLHQVINPSYGLSASSYHEGMVTSSVQLRLIDEWINAGAKNKE